MGADERKLINLEKLIYDGYKTFEIRRAEHFDEHLETGLDLGSRQSS